MRGGQGRRGCAGGGVEWVVPTSARGCPKMARPFCPLIIAGLAGATGARVLSAPAFICRVFFTCALYLCFLCVYRVRQNKPGPFIFRSKYLSLHCAFFCTAVWRGVALALRRCARVGATPADRPFSCYCFLFNDTRHTTHIAQRHMQQRPRVQGHR